MSSLSAGVRLDPATWTPKMPNITISPITVADKIEAVFPLLEDHWLELATDKARMVLKPDARRYAAMEQAGLVIAHGVFEADRMVGYSVGFIGQHLHYSDLTILENDVLFLAKSHRGNGTGQMLIEATEQAARERGAGMVLWHAKGGTALDALLPSLGYSVQDIIHSKAI